MEWCALSVWMQQLHSAEQIPQTNVDGRSLYADRYNDHNGAVSLPLRWTVVQCVIPARVVPAVVPGCEQLRK